MQHVYDYIQQNNYQIPPPPRPVHEKPPKNNENKNPNDDPFGTLKAAKKITEKQPTEKINNVNEDMEVGDDDVFLSNRYSNFSLNNTPNFLVIQKRNITDRVYSPNCNCFSFPLL